MQVHKRRRNSAKKVSKRLLLTSAAAEQLLGCHEQSVGSGRVRQSAKALVKAKKYNSVVYTTGRGRERFITNVSKNASS